MITQQLLEQHGYTHVRQMKDGRWIGILKHIYTSGLCVDLGEFGYARRFCYAKHSEAVAAICVYEGEENPIGLWIKEKGDRGERLGPGALG